MRVNLWPWREEKIQCQRKWFCLVIMTVIALNIISIIGMSMVLRGSLQKNKTVLVLLQKKINETSTITDDLRLQKNRINLLNRVKVMSSCTTQYRDVLNALSIFAAAMPKDLRLVEINMDERHWVLKGVAVNTQSINFLLTELARSAVLSPFRLMNVQHLSQHLSVMFSLEGMTKE